MDGFTSGHFCWRAGQDLLLHATSSVRHRARAHVRRHRDAINITTTVRNPSQIHFNAFAFSLPVYAS